MPLINLVANVTTINNFKIVIFRLRLTWGKANLFFWTQFGYPNIGLPLVLVGNASTYIQNLIGPKKKKKIQQMFFEIL